ncbi:hypothetical protein TIFTF001_006602 [Ficus carica]|uniref:Uncharacterized protein n=1 Tax=Ficus carica TaxID=3494 RepID=A0AA87ZRJ9_FICCA|nr:hypothetical protein TIFTF001_006602 [Ficus carica]
MSAGGAFGGNRGLRPVPPEKGVFPLDHMHLCDLILATSVSSPMPKMLLARNLMAKQDMSELGFGKEADVENV